MIVDKKLDDLQCEIATLEDEIEYQANDIEQCGYSSVQEAVDTLKEKKSKEKVLEEEVKNIRNIARDITPTILASMNKKLDPDNTLYNKIFKSTVDDVVEVIKDDMYEYFGFEEESE